jgi:hypothetical protein
VSAAHCTIAVLHGVICTQQPSRSALHVRLEGCQLHKDTPVRLTDNSAAAAAACMAACMASHGMTVHTYQPQLWRQLHLLLPDGAHCLLQLLQAAGLDPVLRLHP